MPDARPPTRAARRLAALVCVALSLGVGASTSACVRGGASRQPDVPMGSWPAWQDLDPLLDVAKAHVSADAYAVLQSASELLREGKAASADAALAKLANGSARHWIAGARANVAALYFTTIGLSYDLAFGAGARLDVQ